MARTLEIVGEKWALLAIREVFLGNRRFDEMVRRTGAPRDTMTARLKTLVAAGVLERRPVSEHPPRFEYRLTQAGLDLYPVIQPWDTAYDLGPNDEHIQTHKSFASVWHAGLPVRASGQKFWKFSGGAYEYPHPGYAWAWTRSTLDRVGGLFELGGMGAGDHHMALGLAGRAEASLPAGISAGYRNAVLSWGARGAAEINGKLGFAHGTIEHPFHGRKNDRGYESRWKVFLEHGFDPATDLKRNSDGVIEFAGNKPDLERAFDRYLRERNEDVNSLT